MENLLDNFTDYISGLCEKHVEIQHSEEESHFVELNSDAQLKTPSQSYPVVTLDKLEITYTGPEDATRKQRYVELMFLDKVTNNGGNADVTAVKNRMERTAEDFIRKIKLDRKDRGKYPFLKTLKLSEIHLNFVENVSINVHGTLVSFNFDLPFIDKLEPGRFVE